jgi:hypothetical protein
MDYRSFLEMKKFFKLLLMLFLLFAGILFAIMAVTAITRMWDEDSTLILGNNRLSQCGYGIGLAYCCWLGIKKLYDDWYL